MKLNFMTDQGSSLTTASWARRAGNVPFWACLAAWTLAAFGGLGGLGIFGGLGGFGALGAFGALPWLDRIPNCEVLEPAPADGVVTAAG
jgi:hypothetical protein